MNDEFESCVMICQNCGHETAIDPNRTIGAIIVAWSTRGQTTRSHPTTPLAPLREDMAQGIGACAVSSFACRRGTASP